MIARGRETPFAGNKTEAEYRDRLRVREIAGEIAWFAYEAITLKLAPDTRYTPDFAVMLASGELEFHETKGGFVRDDARVKLKVAAAMFPFRFYLAQKEKGVWTITEL